MVGGGQGAGGGGQAAIDHDLLGSDIATLVAGEEEHGVGDVACVTHPPHRHLLVTMGDEAVEVTVGVFVGQALDQRREHQARHHAVQAYAARGVRHGAGLGQLHQRRLGRSIPNLRLAHVAQSGNR
jgi:hypothetical protein